MYKIGMIGDRDSVIGFLSLGFSVHEAQDAESAGTILKELVKSGEYAIIYLVERYAVALRDELDKYKELPLPAITTMPGLSGNSGYGMNTIKTAVEKAVGADILFKDAQ